ncbi:hypothetical protein TrCOL_g8044 [Triparma columacea]|uniref:tRNA/rRNA methyltransferase SpoU type domain-containing protein n=1 Tax=Triparma columacea TaxID=722753 RepID=A0A9W7GRJ5_9STRA|nr:hypothetical protein TrCOL_g8044 [Triparma columacea]
MEATSTLSYFLDLQRNSERHADSSIFIAESVETVRTLLRSPLEVRAVMCKPSIWSSPPGSMRAECVARRSRDDRGFNAVVAELGVMKDVAGYSISRGCIAAGVAPGDRGERDFWRMWEGRKKEEGFRVVAMDKISDTSNLGSIIRTCAGFGISAIVLSSDSCSAWYRRCVRVSMGAVFRIPVYRLGDDGGDEGGGEDGLGRWVEKWRAGGGEAWGTSLGSGCVEISQVGSPPVPLGSSWCLVLGNEGAGVRPSVLEACSNKVRIDMKNGVDSMSVQNAAAVAVHWFVTHEGEGGGGRGREEGGEGGG